VSGFVKYGNRLVKRAVAAECSTKSLWRATARHRADLQGASPSAVRSGAWGWQGFIARPSRRERAGVAGVARLVPPRQRETRSHGATMTRLIARSDPVAAIGVMIAGGAGERPAGQPDRRSVNDTLKLRGSTRRKGVARSPTPSPMCSSSRAGASGASFTR
jgi:hypothetical protein